MSAAEQQISVPVRLREAVAARRDPAGTAWLESLPQLVRDCLDRWKLTLERVFEPGGRAGLVAYVRTDDDSPAVLKLGVPAAMPDLEYAALAHWDGRGAVRLIEAAPEHRAMLLERLHGEVPLLSLAESKAMLEAAGTLQRLWVAPPEPHPFTRVPELVAGLCEELRRHRDLAAAGELRPLLDEALAVADELLADSTEEVLLHGDFHHGNVLAAERSPWLAIDPRPLVGERAYDLAWLAQDRLETLAGVPGPEAAARRRLQRLSDAVDVDRDRLRGWTLFRTVQAGLGSLTADDPRQAALYLEFAAML
ncbi:aminoglycoside phosphotransferase family protein [Streptacidiphilus sp. N1-3]|uniref:Aminoglycoside phosphotransferase family protein n=1 Tax=Streptacidiphilus alkalitolerans TaxID=3342712 RepID=A0ABV6XDY3_9ACTN